jgi:hypothetical protein
MDQKLTIQIGANSRLICTPVNWGLMDEMMTFPYSWVPMPTPTTPKYISTRGHSRQSISTCHRSLRFHGRA